MKLSPDMVSKHGFCYPYLPDYLVYNNWGRYISFISCLQILKEIPSINSCLIVSDYIVWWRRHETYDVMSFGQVQPSPPTKNVRVRLCIAVYRFTSSLVCSTIEPANQLHYMWSMGYWPLKSSECDYVLIILFPSFKRIMNNQNTTIWLCKNTKHIVKLFVVVLIFFRHLFFVQCL